MSMIFHFIVYVRLIDVYVYNGFDQYFSIETKKKYSYHQKLNIKNAKISDNYLNIIIVFCFFIYISRLSNGLSNKNHQFTLIPCVFNYFILSVKTTCNNRNKQILFFYNHYSIFTDDRYEKLLYRVRLRHYFVAKHFPDNWPIGYACLDLLVSEYSNIYSCSTS